MKRAKFGLAKSDDQASSIVNQLKGAGFPGKDISVSFPTRATGASPMWSTTKR
jgi:hypothetical protein